MICHKRGLFPDVVRNKKGSHYVFHVNSNQQDVVRFLVWNNIPFKASVHYGHEGWFYEAYSDHILVIQNFALSYSMYGKSIGLREFEEQKVIRRIPIKQIIAESVEASRCECCRDVKKMSNKELDEMEKRNKILFPDNWRDFTE